MKAFNKLTAIALGVASMAMVGCSDFDEINTSPSAIDALHTQPYYLLAQGIQNIQQNPDTAERTFVINWLTISRIGDSAYDTAIGSYNDGYISTAYSIASNSIKNAARAIEVANIHLDSGKRGERDTKFIKNTIAYARIWRVYAMSEFADEFGPMPLNVAQGVNPTFASLQEVYYYFMDELREAVANIDTDVDATAEEAKSDNAYGWNPVKWKKYGISMWMRLAMRMSEVDPAKAKSEFEAAVAAGDGIKTEDEVFVMPENTGWDDFTAVMSRTWNYLMANATMTNLMTNFGSSAETGLNAAAATYYTSMDYEGTYAPYVKDAHEYLGQDYSEFAETNSDNPVAGFFFDGLPSKIDPRAFVYYTLPHDGPNCKLNYFPYFRNLRALIDDEYMCENVGGDRKIIESTKICKKFAFNGMPIGWGADDKIENNGLFNGTPGRKYMDNGVEKTASTWGFIGSWPLISDYFRAAKGKGRVFFGPWETYFLLAEAAELGWNVRTTAKAAYEAGIKASFDYYDISDAYSEYILSTDYNRVGTSVAFDHVAEPVSYSIKYLDIRTKAEMTKMYEYPKTGNIMYKAGKLNDHRTKILTQKYIANAPWLPLECWSDWRRTGLPFFERPCGTPGNITYLNWSNNQYQSKAQPDQFVQRMRYPSSLKNADPVEYQHALELLGDPENTGKTPLWWAIGGNK